ncbi:MAG: hypothetical protein AAF986_04965 [Pseudomonadota bacterium]
MTDRRILHTLVALFVIAGAGQFLGTVPGLSAVAARVVDNAPSQPIQIVDERRSSRKPIRLVPDEAIEGELPSNENDVDLSAPTASKLRDAEGHEAAMTMPQKMGVQTMATQTVVEPIKLASSNVSSVEVLKVSKKPAAPIIAKASGPQSAPMQRQKLADIYAQMPSNKSAKILSALSPAEAAAFIGLMPHDAGASVLSEMSADVAVAITREVLRGTR